MSITLTTPATFNPGHGRGALTYPEVKIVQVDHEIIAKRMVLHVQYGETISGDWIGAPSLEKGMEILENDPGTADGEGGWTEEPDPAYDLFMVGQFASSTSTFLYDEVGTALYQYLLDANVYAGAIT